MNRDQAVHEAMRLSGAYGHDMTTPVVWESDGDGNTHCVQCQRHAYILNQTTADDDGEVYTAKGRAMNEPCTAPRPSARRN